ncbi:MAG: family 20 glycosylhydrolase [Victivallaceae bacterium]|nr:family 20 glycosylhydrolase [Victivallaceae bacterium]
MTGTFQRTAHVQLAYRRLKVDYLARLFKQLAQMNYDSILLDYGRNFPYRGELAPLCSKQTYSEQEIAQIETALCQNQLTPLVKGVGMSHLSSVVRQSAYASLADGTGLNLAKEESAAFLIAIGEQLLQRHPSAAMLHLGGDEIYDEPRAEESIRHAREHGYSHLYVTFVNRIARHFSSRKVRCAIWSDGLIRHSESLDLLDNEVEVFYWDYWGYAQRCAFLSIGGGSPDLFLLDEAAIPEDTRNAMRSSTIRSGHAIPPAMRRTYGKYWKISEDGRSAESFPYCRFFQDHRVRMRCCMLPYPEKGSFLSRFSAQLSHLQNFIGKARETCAQGIVVCLWQPWWPLWETVLPAFALAAALSENPEAKEDCLWEKASELLGDPWNAPMLRDYCEAGRSFESNDLLDGQWHPIPPGERENRAASSEHNAACALHAAQQFLDRYAQTAPPSAVLSIRMLREVAAEELQYHDFTPSEENASRRGCVDATLAEDFARLLHFVYTADDAEEEYRSRIHYLLHLRKE